MPKKISILLAAVLLLCSFSCKTEQNNSNSNTTVHSSSANKESVFEVQSFTPEDELPLQVKFPQIQIQFTEPVVALKELGQTAEKSDLIKIEPPLEGKFRWLGTSLLCFESKNAVIPQKEYTVTVSSKLKSASGKKISGQLEYKFHSEKLEMVSVVAGYEAIENGEIVDQKDVPVEYAKQIKVFFNAPVNAKLMEKQLQVTTVRGDPYSFTVEKDTDNSVILKLKELPEENTEIFIKLPKGSSSDEGCYPIPEEQVLGFGTILPFKITECHTENIYCDSSYINPVEFTFQHMLPVGKESEIASHFKTLPEMEITEKNIAVDGKIIYLHSLPVSFNSVYTVIIDSELTDCYGKNLDREYTYDIKVPEAASYVEYKDYGLRMLESQFDPKLVFAYQNILKQLSYYSVTPLTDAKGNKVSEKNNVTNFVDRDIPENQKIIEAVDLKPYLQKTAAGFRGALEFYAAIDYTYKVADWYTKEVSKKSSTSKNTQVIQVTDLGMTVRFGYNKAVVLVTSLSTGKPVANAEVNAYKVSNRDNNTSIVVNPGKKIGKAKTDSDGFAVINFSKKELNSFRRGSLSYSVYIEAKTNDDRALFNPDINSAWHFGVKASKMPYVAEDEIMETFMFTDRGLYKPGEKVTFRGIDRTNVAGEYSSYIGDYTVTFQTNSWKPTIYAADTGRTSVNGTFWGEFTIPQDLAPGSYTIMYQRKGSTAKRYCNFTVQFFERLRFEAKSTIADLTYYCGDKIDAEIFAQYLGGGSLGGCAYDVSWSRQPVGFSPEGEQFEGMRFGPLQGYDGTTTFGEESGVLSGAGKATVSQQTGGEKLKGMAYSYRMQANITDSGNQMISTSQRAVVHPAKYYIGISKIKNTKGFPKKGDVLKFDYTCVTPEGNAVLEKDMPSAENRKLKIELLREEWKQVQQIGWNGQINSRYVREMVPEVETSVPLNGALAKNEISVTPPKGGAYLLRLSSVDAKECEVITETRFYVTSSDWYWYNRDNAEEITMITDKEMYSSGDTASILVQSPLPAGRYLMTIEREGILEEKVLNFTEPTNVIEVPVKEEYVPIIYVTLSTYSVRNGMPKNTFDTPDIDKPKGYFGLAAICVDKKEKMFDIEINTDQKTYRPGTEATVTLHASKNGVPLSNAEITLMAVDRGVIDLINYHVPDPVNFFYSEYNFPLCTRGGDSRSLLMDPVTYEVRNLFGGDSADDSSKIEERKNFDPTAVFVPSLITDEEGNATCTFTLPDTITAYRITAVGVNQNYFGIQESEMPVANPVSVRDVLPRKLRIGDVSETGVTVTNLTEEDQQVTVSLKVTDGFEEELNEEELVKLPGSCVTVDETEKTVTVPANSTQAVMFMINAKKEGWVTITYTVNNELVKERIIKPLEIERPYVYETVTTVGQVDSDEKDGSASLEEKIVIPSDADNGNGDIYIQLDATKLGMLHEAVNYVFRYPYGCMEQRASKVFPLIAFSEYLKAFDLNKEVLFPKLVAKKEIKSWKNVQLNNGGFPYWSDETITADLYVSMRIAETIALAQEKGVIDMSDTGINLGTLGEYIQNQINKINQYEEPDSSYTCYLTAYGYYVMSRIGRVISAEEIQAVAENPKSDLNALALCALSYLEIDEESKAKAIAKKIKNYTQCSTRGITLNSTQGVFNYWNYYNDAAEDYSLLLMLYSKLSPKDDINARLVYELLILENQTKGYWKSTAVTNRVLGAFDVYIRANDLTKTNLTAEALLNGQKFVEGKFKGVAAAPVDNKVLFTEEPLKSIPREKEIPLVINRKGNGSLFYTVSMKYAVPASKQLPAEEGICLYTEIYDVKTGELVDADSLESGKVYREKVFISSNLNRNYLALRVPVPSGAEIMNAAFVTTGTFPKEEKEKNPSVTVDVYYENGWDNTYYWYEPYNWGLSHQEIYDNEIQYFWNRFYKGNQQVEFLFRAVRNGTFETPGATAECMYEPEVFGRTSGKVWEIK